MLRYDHTGLQEIPVPDVEKIENCQPDNILPALAGEDTVFRMGSGTITGSLVLSYCYLGFETAYFVNAGRTAQPFCVAIRPLAEWPSTGVFGAGGQESRPAWSSVIAPWGSTQPTS
jgi:hypothetical protein